MATTAQSTVELLVSKYGLAIQGGLYVPTAGAQGFVHPGAVLAGTDPASNQVGYAIPAASTDPSAVLKTGSFPGNTAPVTLVFSIPAPGAGITPYLSWVVCSYTSASATQLCRLIVGGLAGGLSLVFDTIVGTTTAQPVIFTPETGVPGAVNTAITFTVTFFNPTTLAAQNSLGAGNIAAQASPRTPA